MTKPKRVALYLRVSTGEQTTANQKRELAAAARRHGWKIVATFEDNGISGAKGRDRRPGLDALLKGVARKDFDLVAAWSVDRLGRSMSHLVGILDELRGKGVDLYLHVQGLDTGTPAGRAMYQMVGVFAEFERAMIVDRVRAGMSRAKQEGTKSGRPIGRPPVSDATVESIKQRRQAGDGINKIAKALGVGNRTVERVVAEMERTK